MGVPVLHVTGRDVDEAEYALQFHPAVGAWQLLDGPATDHTIGNTRAAILQYVRANPGAKPRDIATALPDTDADTIRRYCSRMAADGQLGKDVAGRYYPAIESGQDDPEVSELSDCPVTPSDQPELPGHPETPTVRLSDSSVRSEK